MGYRLRAVSVWAAALALAGSVQATPRSFEAGLPPVEIYGPDDHGAGTQNFSLAQSPDGSLWVGNLRGVLGWDGAWWRLVPHATAVYAVAADVEGRIAVGGVEGLGLLEADEVGTPRWTPLEDQLPFSPSVLGDVEAIHATSRGFVFVASEFLVRWAGAAFDLILPLPEEPSARSTLLVGDEVWVWTRDDGLRAVGQRGWEELPGGEHLRGRRVDLVLPGGSGGSVLLVLEADGLVEWHLGGVPPVPEDSPGGHWILENGVSSGCFLSDGRWALGSGLAGAIVVGADGQIERIIDGSAGLPDEHVHAVFNDREGFLWLALDNAIARVETASPVSVIDARSGLRGSVSGIARHGGQLWIAASDQYYVLRPGEEDGASGRLVARPVVGAPPPVGSPLVVDNELLLSSRQGVWVVGPEGAMHPVEGTQELVVYVLRQSTVDEARVWVGHRRGLGSVRREPEGWRWEGPIPGAPPYVRTIHERQGQRLWMGTTFDGVQTVPLDEGRPDPEVPFAHLGEGELSLFEVGGQLHAPTGGSLRRIDEANLRLIQDPLAAVLGRGRSFFRMAEDTEGRVWFNTIPPTVLIQGEDGSQSAHRVTGVAAHDIQLLHPEPDGTVWIGSNQGLYRHLGGPLDRPEDPPMPRVRRIRLVDGEVLFDHWRDGGETVVPPGGGRLRVEVTPASFRGGAEYQFRFDPGDRDWGEWSSDPVIDYTNLRVGRHTFRVRSRRLGEGVGAEARHAVIVQPYWYQTVWARGLAFLLAVGFLAGLSSWRHSTLRWQAEWLRSQVEARTEELAGTVTKLRFTQDEVEHQNVLLQEANARLADANTRLEDLSLLDGLTGIANRRAFDRTLDQEWRRSVRRREPLALILADLDEFKLLNDHRGHSEGDECLRRVGAFLSSQARRSEDLVARYGGEEFAALLPGVGTERAAAIAEELRRGIEALGIVHESRPSGGGDGELRGGSDGARERCAGQNSRRRGRPGSLPGQGSGPQPGGSG